MYLISHRNGSKSITLDKAELVNLFELIKNGRIKIKENKPEYDSKFALDLMRLIG